MLSADLRPTEFTYSLLLSAYAKTGNLEKAQTYWQRMLSAGVAPSAVTYNSMLQLHARIGNFEAAEEWMQTMQDRGVTPTIYSYSSLMGVYAEAGNCTRCEEILAQMQASGIALTTIIYNLVIKARVHAGDMVGAEKWFAILDADSTAVADHYTYNTLFFGRLRQGELVEAEELLERMRRAGLEPDPKLLAAIHAARLQQVTRPVDARVDWVELPQTAGGNRHFRSTRGHADLHGGTPTWGLVMLNSEDGQRYYWDVAANSTSWELPEK